jgi:N-acetylglucosaminyl-diphospho-decaprenol L-rhamnosyltransferase
MTSPVPTIDLLVVIVNYRTPELTIQCLRSLESQVRDVPATRVVVTDNASGDDSVPRLQGAIDAHGWSGWCSLVPLPKNGGFSYGNNRGIEAGPKARYVLLLNSDTIVHAGCFKNCIGVMDRSPDAGILGCKLLNADGSLQNSCRKFPTPRRLVSCMIGLPFKLPVLFAQDDTEDPNWDRDISRDVDWLMGAFMLIRGDALERVGGLSEAFFFYGEDIEICHRYMRAGYRRLYDPAGIVTHLGGASSDPTRMPKNARSTHHWRGRYLVQRMCYGRLAEWIVRGTDISLHSLRGLWHRFRGGTASGSFQYHRDVLRTICARLMTLT